jgi:hypothetical protein
VRSGADGYWTTKLSKFVSQPLLLPIVTVVQAPVQFVEMVTRWFTARGAVTVGCPEQMRVIVLGTVPPLKASSWTNRCGVTNVKGSLVGPLPLKLMLFVVN